MPIDDLFNFDDGTSQGWFVTAINMGSIVCECPSPDAPDVVNWFSHSSPYCVRPSVHTTWIPAVHNRGIAKLYDFRLMDKIIITNWIYAYYYSHDFWNLRCFDCDTFAEVFTEYITGFAPGTWTEKVNNVSSQCKGRRICVTFCRGLGSDDIYMDDIHIEATEAPAGAAMGHGAMLQWILALPYRKRFPRIRPLRI